MEKNQQTVCNDGIVKATGENMILVEMTVHSACSNCHAKSACMFQGKKEMLEIPNIGNEIFSVGDHVTIHMQERLGKKALIMAYLVPFLLLMIALFLVVSLTGNELLGFLVSISSLAVYYIVLALYNRNRKIDKQFTFFIQKKI